MQNAPGSEPRDTKRYNTFSNILPHLTAPQQVLNPPLPKHLSRLLEEPWSAEASRNLDLWQQYVQLEFEELA